MDIHPLTLTGNVVRLEPLSEDHVPALSIAGQDESIWEYMRYGDVSTEAGMRLWVRMLLAEQEAGESLPFTVVHQGSGRLIGSTRYMDIRLQHRSVEIGGTWYAPPYQRTAVNTECKYLLLRHAFETLGCVRVQLKTDLRNERSQRAIERIGAVKEGVLRSHMVLPDGYLRDSVLYSIIAQEWPNVKARLETYLANK